MSWSRNDGSLAEFRFEQRNEVFISNCQEKVETATGMQEQFGERELQLQMTGIKSMRLTLEHWRESEREIDRQTDRERDKDEYRRRSRLNE